MKGDPTQGQLVRMSLSRGELSLPVPLLTACLVPLLEPNLAAGCLCCNVCCQMSDRRQNLQLAVMLDSLIFFPQPF